MSLALKRQGILKNFDSVAAQSAAAAALALFSVAAVCQCLFGVISENRVPLGFLRGVNHTSNRWAVRERFNNPRDISRPRINLIIVRVPQIKQQPADSDSLEVGLNQGSLDQLLEESILAFEKNEYSRPALKISAVNKAPTLTPIQVTPAQVQHSISIRQGTARLNTQSTVSTQAQSRIPASVDTHTAEVEKLVISKVPTIQDTKKQVHMEVTNAEASLPKVAPDESGIKLVGSYTIAKNTPSSNAVTATPTVNVVQPTQQESEPPAENTQKVSTQSFGEQALSTQSEMAFDYSGRIAESFTAGQGVMSGVRVQVVGSNEYSMSDTQGRFSFKGIRSKGVLPVIMSKSGYYSRRVELNSQQEVFIELISENSVRLATIAAKANQSGENGFVFGQLVDPETQSLAGYKVVLQSIEDRTVEYSAIYLNDNGTVDSSSSSSSSRGQFIIPNIRAGTYVLMSTDMLDRDRAPTVVHVSPREGIVKKYSLGRKQIISGKLINGSTAESPVQGATVQILGIRAEAITGRDGNFTFGPQYFDCNEQGYIQAEKSEYYRTRNALRCSEQIENYFVFSKSHIDGLASDAQVSLDPHSSILMGHFSAAKRFKAQLVAPEETMIDDHPRGYDFYYGNDGLVNPNQETAGSNKNYVIINAPAGYSYSEVITHNGEMTNSIHPVVLSSSTISVLIQ